MNACALTESKNFKTFLKENYTIALDSCYLPRCKKNVELRIEHDFLIVIMDFAYIRHSCRIYSRFDKYLEI